MPSGDQILDSSDLMRRALKLAAAGEGAVEPNPMVGAVVLDSSGNIVGEGYHEAFGGPHAEVHALRHAGDRARGGTLYVTLEPCCHQGKTPPCTQAVIASGLTRVIVAMQDPFPAVSGKGIDELRAAGIEVTVGQQEEDARELNRPFLTLVEKGRPYVHVKWAMTWDGKIASRSGSSQWISNEKSREIVHNLRRRMDAILVGIGTVRADDPLLTPRPAGTRKLLRIILDPHATLKCDSQLLRTLDAAPVLVAVSQQAPLSEVERLRSAGAEVVSVSTAPSTSEKPQFNLSELLQFLGRRKLTNLLVEGGSQTLGAFRDAALIDETHVFIAPKLIGGREALSPIGGLGIDQMRNALHPRLVETQRLDDDFYLRGRIDHP